MMSSLVDIQFMIHALHQKQLFHLDDISSLWTAFTKCKRQIRDGFRLENLSWRLWYREAIMRKQAAQGSSWQDIELPQKTQQLRRIQSMPVLSLSQPLTPPAPQRQQNEAAKPKFFIDDTSDSEDDEYFSDADSQTSELEVFGNMDQDSLFTKRDLTPTNASPLPSSLLSYMLEEQTHRSTHVGSLHRCHARPAHLNEWFSSANQANATSITG